MAEGNGRLVEVEREYWEAISGGNMKTPPNVLSGRERKAMERRTVLVVQVVDGRSSPDMFPDLNLNIFAAGVYSEIITLF